MFLKNNKSALDNSDFVEFAVRELVSKGLVVECVDAPYIVNPLSVARNSGGKCRLILDLSRINKFIAKKSVKYEDWKMVLLFLKQRCWLVKFDVHSAYHHIDIFGPHTDFLGFSWADFLGFSWETSEGLKFFKFLVLPFGITTAPFLFTKVTRPLVKKWRSEGKQVVMYLDDGLLVGNSYEETVLIAREVKQDLLCSGFVPKVEKCSWEPSQDIEWLGLALDTKEMRLFIPDKRINKALLTCEHLLSLCLSHHRRVHVKSVASLVGQIVSMFMVFGKLTQLMTRFLSIDIVKSPSWNCFITLSRESMQQIVFWRDNLKHKNFRFLNKPTRVTDLVYSDASKTGYGGFCVNSNCGISHGQWSYEESRMSSTWRELKAVHNIMISMIRLLQNRNVKWYTDNKNVEHIVNKGSMKGHLQSIAWDIYNDCVKHGISLEIEWVPRTDNEKADYVSKIVDKDDWAISSDIFDILDRKWGPHTIDRFASYYNTKLPRFTSRFWNPGSLGIDAFSFDWKNENNWIVPPISIIGKVILHISDNIANGTLVVPQWESAYYWPMIMCNKTFQENIKDWFVFSAKKEHFIPSRIDGGLFGETSNSFNMIAMKFRFN